VCAVFSSFVLVNAAQALLAIGFGALDGRFYSSAFTVYSGFLRLIEQYAAHSGVASLQIGALFMLGYRIPERYRYPLFARSPAEFWRRWNTYIGGWARIYVYTPLVMKSMRSRRKHRKGISSARGQGVISAVAIVITFASIGLLHDIFVMSRETRLSFDATRWFVAIGCLVILWESIAIRTGLRNAAWFGRATERILFLATACYAAAYLW
jgi:D-alanyl-lipoteichoic acid acyltransferase DltB (MBOAT superfamily)